MNKKELKQLFEKIKNNEGTIEELYSKYNKTIYAIAFSILKNKEDAEDTVQNVFMKISNLEKEKLPHDKEATWIYTVTKNEALAIIKKRRKDINIEEIYGIEEQNSEIDEIIDKENFNKLISKLNNKEKEIVSLKIISDLSFSQIGNLLDEPVSTIKWRYYKSIYRIKMLLGNLIMFIVTAVLGTSTIKSRKKSSINFIQEDLMVETDEKNEHADSTTSNQTEEQKQGENEETLEQKENTTAEDQEEIGNATSEGTGIEQQDYNLTNQNYLEIGILSFSSIFLIITIITAIFFKKYQLKLNKKIYIGKQ